MRRPLKKKRVWRPDMQYKSEGITRFINAVMWDGKKDTARAIVYEALGKIKEAGTDPLETFDTAIRNVSPLMEVRSRRVGGANYQVPMPVRGDRRYALAYRWLLDAARGKKGKPMAEKLAEEIMLAAKNEGDSVKKRADVQRMADANRAFAHFAR